MTTLAKNGHQKDIYCDKIEMCVQNIDTILGTRLDTSRRTMSSYKVENLHFDIFKCLHLNSILEPEGQPSLTFSLTK